MLEVGIKHEKRIVVTESMLACTAGSGYLPVFATPFMIALMEMTASECVQPHLEDGKSTVGVVVNMEHIDSTPEGVEVVCKVEVVAIDRRKISFTAVVEDSKGIIGRGSHDRFIVDNEKFIKKTMEKISS